MYHGYAMRVLILAPIMISLIAGMFHGREEVPIEWAYLGAGLLMVAALFIYWRSSKKPFAEIIDGVLIIDSVRINKPSIKKMEYWVHSGARRELRVRMEGYDECN